MKKSILLSLVLLAALVARAGVSITTSTFPDSKFRSWVSTNCDTNSDGYLSDSELAAVTSINVAGKGIGDLTGISYFTALTYLNCTGNNLYSINVTRLTALQNLYCGQNHISELDVSRNTALEGLYCHENQLTDLDLHNNTALTFLSCSGNKINGWYTRNFIENLPTKSTSCTIYFKSNSNEENYLVRWMVREARAKKWNPMRYNGGWVAYDGEDVPVTSSYFRDANFRNWVSTNADTDHNGYLSDSELAACTAINVSEKNISNLTGIEHFSALKELNCFLNLLTGIYLEKNTELTKLFCDGNQINPTIDLTKCTKLVELSCGQNDITYLALEKLKNLTALYCDHNKLQTLSVEANTKLETLSAYGNQLTNVYLPPASSSKLWDISLFYNKLTGSAWDNIIVCLPQQSEINRNFFVKHSYNTSLEANEMTRAQVRAARAKNWYPQHYTDASWTHADYEGYGDAQDDAIEFESATTKSLVVGLFDTDHDGELSYREAANAVVADNCFQNTRIDKFNEFRYFTSMTKVPYMCFYGCFYLTEITLPSTVRTIDSNAFHSCTRLSKVSGAYRVDEIGDGAFCSCRSLTTFPFENVRTIHVQAFESSGITDVVLPTSVVNVGYMAFPGNVTLQGSLNAYVTYDFYAGSVAYPETVNGIRLPISAGKLYVSHDLFHRAYVATDNGRERLTPFISGYDRGECDALDFSCEVAVQLPSYCKAYVVTSLDVPNSQFIGTQVSGNVVPAATPVVLKLDESRDYYGQVKLERTAQSATTPTPNLLTAVLSDTGIDNTWGWDDNSGEPEGVNLVFEVWRNEYGCQYEWCTIPHPTTKDAGSTYMHLPVSAFGVDSYWYVGGYKMVFNESAAVPGDLSGDGFVDVDDMNIIINMLLGKVEITSDADLSGDGKVDVDDLNQIINRILLVS